MLVRMLVGISGPDYTLDPGDEWHFPDDEAGRLIDSGAASAVEVAANTPAQARRGKGKRNVVSNDGDDAA